MGNLWPSTEAIYIKHVITGVDMSVLLGEGLEAAYNYISEPKIYLFVVKILLSIQNDETYTSRWWFKSAFAQCVSCW